MKDTQELRNKLLEELKPGRTVGIMSHIEPDGDGFAASLALQLFLRARGMLSEIVVDPGTNLDRFAFLMQGVMIRDHATGLSYDLLIVLDCNSYSRINARGDVVRDSGHRIEL